MIRATYGTTIDLDALGTDLTVVAIDGDHARGQVLSLEVERDRMSDVLERLPRLGPLLDLGVADADVEEIIRGLFAGDARRYGSAETS